MSGDTLTVGESRTFDAASRSVWLHLVAIEAIHSADPKAEIAHSHAIGLLREDIESAVDAAASILSQAHGDPVLQWSVVNNLSNIADEACVDLLHRHAAADYGERDPEACGESRDSAILVGIMAAEGLVTLADGGSMRAIDALIGVVASQVEPAIREAAGAPLRRLAEYGKHDIPDEVEAELKRISELRPLEAEDIRFDPTDIDVREPHRVCARKPGPGGSALAPRAYPTPGGMHNG